MPNWIQERLRNFKSRFNDVLFGSDEGRSVSTRSGRRYWTPGTSTDWESLTGDLWEVPGVMACFGWEMRNLPQAPPQIVTGEGDSEKPVPNHELLKLLKSPNEEYSGQTLLAGVLLSYKIGSDAYIGIERETRGGLPSELYYIPHFMIRPRRDKQTGKIYYEYLWRGRKERIEREDIIHVRNGLDPRNPLCGLSPIAVAYRDGYLLQQGTNYGAKAMKNAGIIGAVASPDPAAQTAGEFETELFTQLWSDKTTGENAGGVLAIDLPIKLQYPNVTPESMAIDTMLDRPEATVAALWGVPPQVCGLHVGRLSKTYANVQEAREIAWEECVVPDGNDIYGQIGAQVLPQISRNAEVERCCLDISKVRPLQPDKDKLHERARLDWEANLIDREQWAIMVGREPQPGDKGLFFKDVQVEQQSTLIDKQGAVDKQNLSARNGAASNGKVLA